MNLKGLRKNAQDLLDRYAAYMEEMAALTDEELEQMPPAPFDSGALINAERTLVLCDEIFPKITQEERDRINAIPAFKTDLREVKDIKDRYGLTWSELKLLRFTDSTKLGSARTAAGMSQSQLAAAAGVNLRTLQDYEQGRKSINGAAAITVYKLATALGVRMEALLEAED